MLNTCFTNGKETRGVLLYNKDTDLAASGENGGDKNMKLGVITDCLKRPFKEAVEIAHALGVTGVQIYATKEDLCPEVLDAEARAGLRAFLLSRGIELSALCGDFGGHGFEREEGNALRVARTKAVIDLAADLGTSVVTTHIGVIPSDENDPRYGVMLRALTECGLYAKSRGVTLAIETGPEPAATLLRFLERTQGGIGVNLDPANFIMLVGEDPVPAVDLLGRYIVHTHIKDGRRAEGNEPPYVELPVGEGDVPWDRYLAALKRVGYDGYLTVEREDGDDRVADVRTAVDFIRKKLAD